MFVRRSVAAVVSQVRHFHPTGLAAMPIKVGDKFPSVDLCEGTPDAKVDLSKEKGKFVVFGVPGAFTGGCSKTHLPGFVENADTIKKKGVKEIFCVSVNDPFVMDAWGKDHKCDGKVRMLADPRAELAKAMDVDIDLTAALGNVRTKRFSMLVEDGVVKKMNLEADGTGLSCSLAPEILKQI